VLSTSILPPIISVIFLTIVSPSPVPCTPLNVVFFSRSNGSKICFKNPSPMPMPVSSTINWHTI